ncbi:hypothetical protein TrCOL_g2482 [Triparma columacea]|uniref:Serine/threonine-protein phosphatase n=1 Tax=Triparma columacea TaxID=722753 RepID=A0A9W7LEL9_9STRA|nr:hypothetical protein TrCOL_g2482 [Triparma columacea]
MLKSKGGKKGRESSLTEDKVKALLTEKDAKISALTAEISKLTNALNNSNVAGAGRAVASTTRRQHPLTAFSTTITSTGDGTTQVRSRMGRHASMSSQNVLNALPDEVEDSLAIRIVEMFKDPNKHLAYLKSEQFAMDILTMASRVRPVLEDEPRCIFLQSPCYVFGDIHGNLEDLHFFSDNIWRLGMSLTAGNFLFLGDYVDRGLSCLEVVAYLFAMKLLLPHKVFLLRGNHETRDVNGWEEHYGERSYIHQCRERFGEEVGYRVWEETNQVFDRIPLSAVIDQDIFCVHGGIPRAVSRESRIQDILSVPKVAGINPPYEHETEEYQQVASDCIWSDPASDEQEACGVDPHSGFGESLRGGGAICFGHKAVTNFLQQQGFSYIMRAHEAHAEGVAVSKGARVFTVFSTSKDHNQGSQAMAGCILVDFEKMKVINRSPAYRNKFVHRRDSVSLAGMTEAEIAQRAQLGLVTAAEEPDEDEYEDYEDYDDEEEEYEYLTGATNFQPFTSNR